MKKFVALFLMFSVSMVCFYGCATNLQKELNKESKKLSNYTMDIKYNSDNTMHIDEEVEYVNNTDVKLNEVYFHLYPNNFKYTAVHKPVAILYNDKAYPNGFSEGKIDIEKVNVDGVDSEINLCGNDEDFLKVDVNLSPLDRVKITLTCNVTIPNASHRFGYGENAINVANFYPIAVVYDNGWQLNPYHSNGDPFYSDMANYNVTISAPSDLVLASTGVINKQTASDNDTIYQINAKVVRDFAFVMSDKYNVATKTINHVRVNYFYYDDENFSQSLQSAVDSISTFSSLFGEYPYSTYSVCKSNFIYGGMEYPNLVIISDAIADYNDYVNTIVHETAHQWWYGVVGNDEYSYGWLDEGLTDYSTALFYKYNPNYGIDMDDIIKNTTNSYVNFVEVYTKVLGGVDTTMNRTLNEFNTEPEYVYIAYVKGALLFDSLRENVGEKKFLEIMQKYYKTYKYKNVDPNCLIGVFEKYLGCEMNNFFNSWIDGKVIIKRVA